VEDLFAVERTVSSSSREDDVSL